MSLVGSCRERSTGETGTSRTNRTSRPRFVVSAPNPSVEVSSVARGIRTHGPRGRKRRRASRSDFDASRRIRSVTTGGRTQACWSTTSRACRYTMATVWVVGFEPAISCSRSRRSGQTELHPEEVATTRVRRQQALRPSGAPASSPARLAARGRWSRTSTTGSQWSPLCIRRGWSRRESNPHLSGFDRALDHRAVGPSQRARCASPTRGSDCRSPSCSPAKSADERRSPSCSLTTSADERGHLRAARRSCGSAANEVRASSGSCTRTPGFGRPGPYCWTMLAIPIRALVRGVARAPRWRRGTREGRQRALVQVEPLTGVAPVSPSYQEGVVLRRLERPTRPVGLVPSCEGWSRTTISPVNGRTLCH